MVTSKDAARYSARINMMTKSTIIFSGLACLCAVIVSIVITYLFDSGLLGNDFAQMYSVASNLAQGNGLKTNLIYYDVHYEMAATMVPQTVFPPGLSAIVAPLLMLGLPKYASVLALSMAAFLATGLLIALCTRRLGGRDWAMFLASALWFALGVNWANVLLVRSEVPFTFATVAALYGLIRWNQGESASRALLFLTGFAAACAFLFRYQGLFFIGSIGLFFLLRLWHKRDQSALIDLLVVSSLPVITVTILIAHNLLVTGGMGGGPVDYAQHSASLPRVALGFYYEFSRILGVSKDELLRGGASELIAVALFIFGIYSIIRYRVLQQAWQASISTGPVGFCVIYLAVSMAALIYLSLTKSTGFIQARYLSTLLPFVIVYLVAVGQRIRQRVPIPRTTIILGISLLTGFLVFGQGRAISEILDEWSLDTRLHDIRLAMETSHDSKTIRFFLQEEIDNGNHVLVHQSQLAGHVLDRTTFGLTPALYTNTTFDREKVLSMIDDHQLMYVLFFPKLYDPDARQNRNRIILTELLTGKGPDWLTLVVVTPEIQLYRITRTGLQRRKDSL